MWCAGGLTTALPPRTSLNAAETRSSSGLAAVTFGLAKRWSRSQPDQSRLEEIRVFTPYEIPRLGIL